MLYLFVIFGIIALIAGNFLGAKLSPSEQKLEDFRKIAKQKGFNIKVVAMPFWTTPTQITERHIQAMQALLPKEATKKGMITRYVLKHQKFCPKLCFIKTPNAKTPATSSTDATYVWQLMHYAPNTSTPMVRQKGQKIHDLVQQSPLSLPNTPINAHVQALVLDEHAAFLFLYDDKIAGDVNNMDHITKIMQAAITQLPCIS